MNRSVKISRKTSETNITLNLNLDGGAREIATGIGFFDHMLNSLATHANFGLNVKAIGDLHVDMHHTVEDVGIVLGQAFAKALEDKTGIRRFATAFIPMDESLAFASCDISGRPFFVLNMSNINLEGLKVGEFDAGLTEEFFRAFATNAGITLHLKLEYGTNTHHIIEALFKATARCLKSAVQVVSNDLPSTKGML